MDDGTLRLHRHVVSWNRLFAGCVLSALWRGVMGVKNGIELPAHTWHWANAGLMLGNVNPALAQCIVLARLDSHKPVLRSMSYVSLFSSIQIFTLIGGWLLVLQMSCYLTWLIIFGFFVLLLLLGNINTSHILIFDSMWAKTKTALRWLKPAFCKLCQVWYSGCESMIRLQTNVANAFPVALSSHITLTKHKIRIYHCLGTRLGRRINLKLTNWTKQS